MSRKRRVGAVVDEEPHLAKVGSIHVFLLLIRHRCRLTIRALHQAHSRAHLVHLSQVALGAIQTRLEDDADVPILEVPQRLEDFERHLRVRRALHVDADEKLVLPRRFEDASHVVNAGGAIDHQAQLRELQRDIAFDVGRDDVVDEPDVLARCRRGLIGGRRRSRRDSPASAAVPLPEARAPPRSHRRSVHRR